MTVAAAVAERIAHYEGIRVVEDGRLNRPDMGHAAGTAYVLIEAETLLDCDDAQAALGDLGGVPDLAWERGWYAARPGGIWPLRLRIFPKESLLRRA